MAQYPDPSEEELSSLNTSPTTPTTSSTSSTSGTLPSANQLRSDNIRSMRIESISSWDSFLNEYNTFSCFMYKVNDMYKAQNKRQQRKETKAIVGGKGNGGIDSNEKNESAAKFVFKRYLTESKNFLNQCLKNQPPEKTAETTETKETEQKVIPGIANAPFDRRLDRLLATLKNEGISSIPYSLASKQPGTGGYFVKPTYVDAMKAKDADKIKKASDEAKKLLINNDVYSGVGSIANPYAITKLYGSDGGKRLINKRGERKWYEVAENNKNLPGYSMNPTTSSLISWGSSDSNGRTPYHFTDFVFAKYWKKIENNRLITLRRYAAPVPDNLNFRGMYGNDNASVIAFPPMATAISYFGGDTGNSLTKLLSFSTGLPWEDLQAEIWTVTANSTPSSETGPAGLFPGLSTLAASLNVLQGGADSELVANKGALPPDPYTDGPYENRILGPINRITSVKKRKAGLNFEWSGLSVVHEYVARPIGGINPKAVLLDILSNFLVIGSANAVFFGGQHRFMSDPAIHPFPGGDKGIEAWYRGKPEIWAQETLTSYTTQSKSIAKEGMNFFDSILSGIKNLSGAEILGALSGQFKDGGMGKDVVNYIAASKSTGQVPYLSNMKALLTGEAIGEWHLTIGNPLNPIAMIGNLVCTGIEVEFGEELGPDDFPTELKVTVKLEHGMPRDRDAIQSIFNKGMGRIYDLPDDLQGTGDGETKVDKYTAQSKDNAGKIFKPVGWIANSQTTGGNAGEPAVNSEANHTQPSVWDPIQFLEVPSDSNLEWSDDGQLLKRSEYRIADWIAQKSLI